MVRIILVWHTLEDNGKGRNSNRKGVKMNKYIDSREHKEEKPVIAICYDFDKTFYGEKRAEKYTAAIRLLEED